jgi:glycosyltransferase involved in cell wall biosynthesis
VVPAYNAMATLSGCLASLQKQDRIPDEIIVVDDGSTDETGSVAQRFGAKVIRQEHHGAAAARNLGIQQAQGEIVLFTDADCAPASNWVSEMLGPFADPGVAGVKGAYRTRQNEVVARLVQQEFEERYDRLERLASIDLIDTYAAAFRTCVLRQIGGFEPALPHNEDVELSYGLAGAGYKLMFNRRAAVYHRHPVTWGAYISTKIKRGFWRMVVYRFHPRKAVIDSYTPQLLKLQVFLVYGVITGMTLALVWPIAGWVAGISLACLLVSAIPFLVRLRKSDSQIAPWAMIFVTFRAVAFALGVAAGLVGMIVFRPARRVRTLPDSV